ncbi:MAG: chromosome partitioning protein ParB [Planctomycetaceae bacterium]|nr:chromosome partitioning protein ParB [Planctomycetaceae bacterium]
MSKNRRLGKGLADLLGQPPQKSEPSSVTPSTTKAVVAGTATEAPDGYSMLPLGSIDENPYQPRTQFDQVQLEALAASLKQHDLLQAIVVRQVGNRYQLISGERRFKAATLLGWKTIPARIRKASDREAAELAIIENLQRKDLGPLEKAVSFKQYLKQHHCTQAELATRLNVDRSTVSNLIRLLELPEQVQDALRHQLITAGHARAMLPLKALEQIDLCERIVRESLSVRNIEQHVQRKLTNDQTGKQTPAKPAKTKSAQIELLEKQLKIALGTHVKIAEKDKGSGKIVINFSSSKEFSRLMNLLTGSSVQKDRAA